MWSQISELFSGLLLIAVIIFILWGLGIKRLLIFILYVGGLISLIFLFGESGILLIAISFYVVIGLTTLISNFFKQHKQNKINQTLLDKHPNKIDLPDFSWWMKNIEPKYRNLTTYPPDWGIRRKYIAEIYKHQCGVCGQSVKVSSGHVHHVKLLKKCGTNSIDNLVFLCRHCHEDQHEHLKYYKNLRLKITKERGITEEEYLKEKAEERKLMQVLLKKYHVNLK